MDSRRFVARDLIVDGQMLYDFLDNDDTTKSLISRDLGINIRNQEIANELSNALLRLKAGDFGEDIATAFPVLCGIEGFSTFLFLLAADGRVLNCKPEHRIKLTGQIIDFSLILDESSDPVTGNGRLIVDTQLQIFKTNEQLIQCSPDECVNFRWDVRVHKYTLYERSTDPNDFRDCPFPVLQGKLPDKEERIKFPPAALDPDNSSSLWCRCLDHKIYAEGLDLQEGESGNTIEICNIWQAPCGDGLQHFPSDQDLDDYRLPNDHCWYRVTSASCVDLLLKKGVDGKLPSTEQDLFAIGGDYCLGRCAHPPIVNTNGT